MEAGGRRMREEEWSSELKTADSTPETTDVALVDFTEIVIK